jgi:hypothetical protein
MNKSWLLATSVCTNAEYDIAPAARVGARRRYQLAAVQLLRPQQLGATAYAFVGWLMLSFRHRWDVLAAVLDQ